MTDSIEIEPLTGPLQAAICPPGSKSITNRALLMAALAHGESILKEALDSDDTRVMIDSLKRLGIQVHHFPTESKIVVRGCGGQIPQPAAELYVENSGTTIRFLTAVLGVIGGQYVLDGVARMRERPIGPLTDALTALGGNVVAKSTGKCPPVQIDSPRLVGGQVKLRGDLSSQYLSGLLMAAPLATNGLIITIDGELVSRPYVEMTLKMMWDFGVQCLVDSVFTRFEIKPDQLYVARQYHVEPDASAASYFWAAAAICGGQVTVQGLNENALQGDVRFVRVLEKMGCHLRLESDLITVIGPARYGIDVDMGDISDTVQTLAAVALFVQGPTTIRNIAHNRVKETDRIHFLAVELRKLGAEVIEFPDGLTIIPRPLHSATIDTYSDHRMAMSFSLVGLRVPGIKIRNPQCVAKTYPNFFQDLKWFCNSKASP
jgi:3-phosphoshikimate 1-carboxyvinyltransferase